MTTIDPIIRSFNPPSPGAHGAKTIDTSDPKLAEALRKFEQSGAKLKQFLKQHLINVEAAIDLTALTQALRRAAGEQGGIPAEVLDTLTIHVSPDSPLFGLTQAGSGEVSLRDALASFGVGADGTGTATGLAQILETLEGKSKTLDNLNRTELMQLTLLQSEYTMAAEVCKKTLDIVAETNRRFATQG